MLGVHCASHAVLVVADIGAQWWRRDDDATSPVPGPCVPASGLAPGRGGEGGRGGWLNQLYSRCKSVSSFPPPVEMPFGDHVSPEVGFAESPPCRVQLLSSRSASVRFHALSAVAAVPSSVPPASASVVHLRGSGSHPVAARMCMHFSNESVLLHHALTYRTPTQIHTNHIMQGQVFITVLARYNCIYGKLRTLL